MSNAREHRRSRPCRSREAQKRRCQCRPLSQKQNLHCGSETRLRRPQGRSSRFFKYCQAAFGSNQRAWGAGLLLICSATAHPRSSACLMLAYASQGTSCCRFNPTLFSSRAPCFSCTVYKWSHPSLSIHIGSLWTLGTDCRSHQTVGFSLMYPSTISLAASRLPRTPSLSLSMLSIRDTSSSGDHVRSWSV
jgi:hypothetical protein